MRLQMVLQFRHYVICIDGNKQVPSRLYKNWLLKGQESRTPLTYLIDIYRVSSSFDYSSDGSGHELTFDNTLHPRHLTIPPLKVLRVDTQ